MQGQAEINSLNTFGGLTAIQSSDLLQLPTELLFRIISYLTQSTIPSLMVCRALRPLCEELLYKSIFLPTGTNRSRRLLETFLLRPDLADLVQHLFIDLSWAEDLIRKQGLTNLGQLNPLYPLSLARNLRSFAPSEVDFWIWSPDMVAFREAVFNMRLVKLEIPTIRDPRIGYTHTQAIRWDGDLGDEFRKLFQKQPLLQELILPRRLATMTVNSLMTKLQLSDIPNLKSLHADPVAALAFLPVIATKLENLTFLASGDWNDQLFSRLQTASKAVGPCLLRFSIMAWYQSRDRRWVWDNLDKVFGLFPNVETLCVTIASLTTVQDMPHAGYYFTKVEWTH
ncbi:hypothetical protein FRB90_000766 [Tulasnella sp. 427]|nr:hypothetical protein FRB90_000766 [Tulasnella sp. 427]